MNIPCMSAVSKEESVAFTFHLISVSQTHDRQELSLHVASTIFQDKNKDPQETDET